MDQHYTDDLLKRRKIGEKQRIFFVQRLMEFLHPLTLDTYSIRATNSHSILNELVDVITLLVSGIIKDGNLKPLREECLAVISSDIVLDVHAKQIKNTVLSYVSNHKNNLATTKYHLKWALNILKERYLTWCLLSLETALTSNDFDQIKSVTSTLITELVHKGWTVEELYALVKKLITNSRRRNFESAFKELTYGFSQQKKSFVCLAKIPNSESTELDALFKYAKYEVMDADTVKAKFDIPSLKDKLSPHNSYVQIDVLAFAGQGAARRAFAEILHQINIMSFYELDMSPFNQGITIVVIDAEQNKVISSDTQFPRSHRKHTQFSAKLFESTIDVLERENENHDARERFQSLFLYSRLAEDSLLPEGSFLNYWVALESFTKVDDRLPIEQITSVVPAVLSNRYIYRLLRNFFEDCKRCSVNLNSISPVFSMDSYGQIVRELLIMIRDSNESSRLEQLCSSHTLLLYRYRKLRSALSNSDNILELTRRHYENVQMQLARLYRVRNEIAHCGTSPNNLEQLLTNLKTYVRQTAQETLYRLDRAPNSTIPEILAQICDSYTCSERLLKDKNFTYDEVFLLEGPFHDSI